MKVCILLPVIPIKRLELLLIPNSPRAPIRAEDKALQQIYGLQFMVV